MDDIEDGVLESARIGEKASVEKLFNYVIGLAGRVLASRAPKAEIDDLRQECMVRILRCLPTLSDKSHLRKVVILSAEHALVDHIRKVCVRERIKFLPTDELGHFVVEQFNPVEMEEVEAIVNAALSRMALHLRQTYHLLSVEGLTMKAAAKRLNVSASTVGTWRRKLTAQFMESFYGE